MLCVFSLNFPFTEVRFACILFHCKTLHRINVLLFSIPVSVSTLKSTSHSTIFSLRYLTRASTRKLSSQEMQNFIVISCHLKLILNLLHSSLNFSFWIIYLQQFPKNETIFSLCITFVYILYVLI